MGPLRCVLGPGLTKAESVDTLMVFGIGSWKPFRQVQVQRIMSWVLIAKPKIEIGMMLRLQGTPGDLFLPHEHKIDPDIMISTHKGGMKHPCMNNNQIVILHK